jgi:hypothetical protein
MGTVCAISATWGARFIGQTCAIYQTLAYLASSSQFKVTKGFLPAPIRVIEIWPIFSRKHKARHFWSRESPKRRKLYVVKCTGLL